MERRRNIFEESRKYQLGSDGNVPSTLGPRFPDQLKNPNTGRPDKPIDPNNFNPFAQPSSTPKPFVPNLDTFDAGSGMGSPKFYQDYRDQQEARKLSAQHKGSEAYNKKYGALQNTASNQQYVKPLQVASGRERRLRNNISNNPYFNKMNPSMNSGFVEQEGQERNSIYGSNPYFNSFV